MKLTLYNIKYKLKVIFGAPALDRLFKKPNHNVFKLLEKILQEAILNNRPTTYENNFHNQTFSASNNILKE